MEEEQPRRAEIPSRKETQGENDFGASSTATAGVRSIRRKGRSWKEERYYVRRCVMERPREAEEEIEE